MLAQGLRQRVIQAKRKDARATQWAGCCAVPISMNYLSSLTC